MNDELDLIESES